MNTSDVISRNESKKMIDYSNLVYPVWVGLIASIFGFFGNLWFLVVVTSVKALQKSVYRILLSVIVTDTVINVLFPFESIQNLVFFETGEFFAADACIVTSPALVTLVYSSITGQFLISLNRGIAVFKPILYRSYMTIRNVSVIVLVACYLIPCAYFIGLIHWEITYPVDPNLGDCTYRFKSEVSKELVNIVYNYLPIFGSMVVYAAISMRIVLTAKVNRSEIIKRARGSLNMFFCMFVFGCSFIAIPIGRSLGIFGRDINATMWFIVFARISFTLNPIFYIVFDSQLRKGSFVLLKKRTSRVSDQSTTVEGSVF